MKVIFTKRVLVLVLILFIFGCFSQKRKNDIQRELTFDGIKEVPEWLKLNVDEAFPINGLNIWVPTNNFQTSSLIRVPRFPRKFSAQEINDNKALKDFEIIPLQVDKVLEISAIRNEQVSVQIAIGAKKNLSQVDIKISDLKGKNGEVFNKKNIQIRYVKYLSVERARSEYVWSPMLEEIVGEGVSGTMSPNVVGDPLIVTDSINVPAYRAQPVWITFKIPKNTTPGIYEGIVSIHSHEFGLIKHKLRLKVLDIQLPDYQDYKFHLDLWLNPSAIAEYYHLDDWSEDHWNMISKYLEDYASRGGKNITTIITHEPWHKPWINNTTISQSLFGYKSMILWVMDEQGNWEFDYTIFDKYVQLATNLGIDEAINAFSLAPFHTSQKIHYYDKKDKRNRVLELEIDEKLYEDIWVKFLGDFKEHLIKKDLFERTYLGFDEKQENELVKLQKIINKGAPEFLKRIVIAGHIETTKFAQNLSISYMYFPNQPLADKAAMPILPTIEIRNSEDKLTTFYLCAEPAHPNTLTYSPAVESQMIPWLALKYNTNGYLRWAYNNWTEDPFNKPVFIHNQGDDYYVYPGEDGPISSIRWELLKEGIEDYELFRIIEEKGDISNDSLNKAIELATRNQDGRYKNVDDLMKSRSILLVVGNHRKKTNNEKDNN